MIARNRRKKPEKIDATAGPIPEESRQRARRWVKLLLTEGEQPQPNRDTVREVPPCAGTAGLAVLAGVVEAEEGVSDE